MEKMNLTNPLASLLVIVGLIFVVWRIFIGMDVFGQGGGEELWADLYFLVALYGGFAGVIISRSWGGAKSLVGKAILSFSVGLFLQSFGQGVYAYYAIFQGVEAAYPSYGDIGFFGSIPAYLVGILYLAKIARVNLSLRSTKGLLMAIIIPVLILAGSYYIFLDGYEFDWTNPLAVILDFAYPLGQAAYLAVAILVLSLSAGYLGGIMKRPLIYLLFALVIQYLSDFVFLYRFNQESYVVGGLTDIMYLFAYFFMGFSLIYLGFIFQRIRSNE